MPQRLAPHQAPTAAAATATTTDVPLRCPPPPDSESGNVHRMPARCFPPGRIPALQPGAQSKEEMREIEPAELPSRNGGFPDSGNGGRPPVVQRVALIDWTSLPGRRLFGLPAHSGSHQKRLTFKRKHVREKDRRKSGGGEASSV